MDLTVGSLIVPTGIVQADSAISVVRTATGDLVPGIDFLTYADPTLGDMTLTLPDAEANDKVAFRVKRIVNGANVVTIDTTGTDKIDGTDNFILGLVNDHVFVTSDGVEWHILDQRTFSVASMSVGAGSFSLTAAFTKFDQWTGDVFKTPGRLVTDVPNDRLDVLQFSGPVQDAYQIQVMLSVEFSTNKFVTAQMYANGALVGPQSSQNAFGSGKPITLSITAPIIITSTTQIELHLLGESAATLTILSGELTASRIGG